MASVTFEHLEKTYPNGYHAIRDFNLQVRDGELMVLVGPSGCGKSTVLRLLAGLEEITSGTLRIGDRVANHLSPQDRNIAMVFQDYALYPTMTVRGNLEFPLKMRKLGKDEIRRRVEWAAGLLGLAEVMDRLPKQLSGGQRQRVAMGRALVREPSVFLLDEPLSNLDAKLRTQVRAEIGDLQRRMGATMIYVTHDQVEAMTLGQRIAVLNRGEIQQVADPKTLYEHPANAFVAGFIGSPPMNLFEAVFDRDIDGRGRLLVNGQVVADVDAGSGKILFGSPHPIPPQSQTAAPGAPEPPFPSQTVASARPFPEGEGVKFPPEEVVKAGIRPEALRLAEPSEPGFEAVAVNAEYLGHETLLHFHPGRAGEIPAGAVPWTARLPGMHFFAKDEAVRLAVAPGQVYFFEA
jgi:multiple sugar transport system ATP-binding protein